MPLDDNSDNILILEPLLDRLDQIEQRLAGLETALRSVITIVEKLCESGGSRELPFESHLNEALKRET